MLSERWSRTKYKTKIKACACVNVKRKIEIKRKFYLHGTSAVQVGPTKAVKHVYSYSTHSERLKTWQNKILRCSSYILPHNHNVWIVCEWLNCPLLSSSKINGQEGGGMFFSRFLFWTCTRATVQMSINVEHRIKLWAMAAVKSDELASEEAHITRIKDRYTWQAGKVIPYRFMFHLMFH